MSRHNTREFLISGYQTVTLEYIDGGNYILLYMGDDFVAVDSQKAREIGEALIQAASSTGTNGREVLTDG